METRPSKEEQTPLAVQEEEKVVVNGGHVTVVDHVEIETANHHSEELIYKILDSPPIHLTTLFAFQVTLI